MMPFKCGKLDIWLTVSSRDVVGMEGTRGRSPNPYRRLRAALGVVDVKSSEVREGESEQSNSRS